MNIILSYLSGIIRIYSFIIIFRIIITWFSGTEMHSGVFSFLKVITDPYLNLFRRIKFLQRGAMDFSIIFAILVLNIIAFVLEYLAEVQVFNAVTVIGVIFLAAYQTLFFLLIFFAILVVILFIIITVIKQTYSQIYFSLLSILEPLTSFISKCIPGGRKLSLTQILVITFIFISMLCLFGFFVIEPSLGYLLIWSMAK